MRAGGICSIHGRVRATSYELRVQVRVFIACTCSSGVLVLLTYFPVDLVLAHVLRTHMQIPTSIGFHSTSSTAPVSKPPSSPHWSMCGPAIVNRFESIRDQNKHPNPIPILNPERALVSRQVTMAPVSPVQTSFTSTQVPLPPFPLPIHFLFTATIDSLSCSPLSPLIRLSPLMFSCSPLYPLIRLSPLILPSQPRPNTRTSTPLRTCFVVSRRGDDPPSGS